MQMTGVESLTHSSRFQEGCQTKCPIHPLRRASARDTKWHKNVTCFTEMILNPECLELVFPGQKLRVALMLISCSFETSTSVETKVKGSTEIVVLQTIALHYPPLGLNAP